MMIFLNDPLRGKSNLGRGNCERCSVYLKPGNIPNYLMAYQPRELDRAVSCKGNDMVISKRT